MSRIRELAEHAEGVASQPARRTRRRLVPVSAALACAALTLAACGNGGDATTSANSSASSQSSTQQSQSQSSTQSGSGSQSSTQSNTQSTTQSGGGSLSQSSFSTDEGTVRTFAGTSGSTLTVDTDGPSRLLWSNDRGRRFRLHGAGAAVDSTAGAGEIPLAAGSHRLEVHGAVWTIVIRPR